MGRWSSSISCTKRHLLARLYCRCLLGQFADLGPRDDEAVIGERLTRPLLPLAYVVEPVGQIAGDLSDAADAAQEVGRCNLATGFQSVDQVLGDLPVADLAVGRRVPV